MSGQFARMVYYVHHICSSVEGDTLKSDQAIYSLSWDRCAIIGKLLLEMAICLSLIHQVSLLSSYTSEYVCVVLDIKKPGVWHIAPRAK